MKSCSRLLFLCALLSIAVAPTSADERSHALLREVDSRTGALTSLSAHVLFRERAGSLTWTWRGTIDLRRPNLARVVLSQRTPDGVLKQRFVSDGTAVWSWTSWPNEVRTGPVDAQGREINPIYWGLPISYFFAGLATYFPAGGPIASRYVGTETIEGKSYQHIEVSGGRYERRAFQLYIGTDGLLHRSVITLKLLDEERTYECVLDDVVTGKAIAAATFRFTPPKGVPVRPAITAEERSKTLLQMGQLAPSFDLPTLEGGRVTLVDAIKGRRATLINFWFHG